MSKVASSTLPVQSILSSDEAPFDALKQSIFVDLHVATIGVVTAISGSLLTVQPVINERGIRPDGSIQWLQLPAIPDTPYVGNAPNVGDSVLLIICDCDISGWIKNGGADSTGKPNPQNTQIQSYHSLSHAVAVTGLSTNTDAIIPNQYVPITGSTANNGSGVSDALVEFLENQEGCRLNWYDDGTGVQTIGYGHTGSLPSGYTAPLTSTTATALLQYDLTRFIDGVQSTFSTYTLKQNQFDAMVSLFYNVGSISTSSNLYKDIISNASSATLKTDFEAYCHAASTGEVIQGLLTRRDLEWNMFCNDVYSKRG